MKYCASHIYDMTLSLKARGVAHLIQHTSNEEVVKFAQQYLAGEMARREDFDPLIVMSMEINAKLERIAQQRYPGTCPLCEVARLLKDADAPEKWIRGFTDSLVDAIKKLGLIAA